MSTKLRIVRDPPRPESEDTTEILLEAYWPSPIWIVILAIGMALIGIGAGLLSGPWDPHVFEWMQRGGQ